MQYRFLALSAAALAMTACASNLGHEGPGTQRMAAKAGDFRTPTLEAPAEDYLWDDGKSRALNIAILSGDHPSLRDAWVFRESGQREVTTGERVGGFLLNFAGGNLAGAISHDHVAGQRGASYEFDPYAVLLIPVSKIEEQDNGGFSTILGLIEEEFTSALKAHNDDTRIVFDAYNDAILDYRQEGVRYMHAGYDSFVMNIWGGACDSVLEESRYPQRFIMDNDADVEYNTHAVNKHINMATCLVRGSVSPLVKVSNVPWSDEDHYAYEVKITSNAWLEQMITGDNLAWVIPLEWYNGRGRVRTMAPFVAHKDRLWFFTESNDNEPMSDYF